MSLESLHDDLEDPRISDEDLGHHRIAILSLRRHGSAAAAHGGPVPLSVVHLHTNLFARAGGANRCRLQRRTTSPIIQARPGAWDQRERLREWSLPRSRESRVAARRALDIRSPIMSSVNNHRAARTHAAGLAGLRAMLTGLCARKNLAPKIFAVRRRLYVRALGRALYCRFCAVPFRLLGISRRTLRFHLVCELVNAPSLEE